MAQLNAAKIRKSRGDFKRRGGFLCIFLKIPLTSALAVCIYLRRHCHDRRCPPLWDDEGTAPFVASSSSSEIIVMQIKLFTIPIGDNGGALEEMNRFLRGNKILEVQNQLISNENGASWCFCVRYIERAFVPTEEHKSKVDYKQALDEATFQKFAQLREIRKKVAAEEGVPAFAVFTDEELARLAKLEKITPQTMLSVKGIGDKKVERFAKYFTSSAKENEKSGTSS